MNRLVMICQNITSSKEQPFDLFFFSSTFSLVLIKWINPQFSWQEKIVQRCRDLHGYLLPCHWCQSQDQALQTFWTFSSLIFTSTSAVIYISHWSHSFIRICNLLLIYLTISSVRGLVACRLPLLQPKRKEGTIIWSLIQIS